MNKEKISQIIDQIDNKYIDEATLYALNSGGSQPGKKRKIPVWAAVAAGLVLFAVIGITTFTLVAEAKEYQAAAAFFEENGLSTEGLTRTEVKEVYRDITAKSFTYGKTADVIRQAVPGLEIQQQEPTPEELATLWDINILGNTLPRSGIKLVDDDVFEYDEELGADTLKKGILNCYKDSSLLWSAEFPDAYCSYYEYTNEGTVVAGFWQTMVYSETLDWMVCKDDPWVAVLDSNGAITWQTALDHGFTNYMSFSALKNDDGTWTVFYNADMTYLCVSCFDEQGNEISFHKTEVGNNYVCNSAHLEGGYILQLVSRYPEYKSMLYRMDREGNLQGSFSYEAEDLDYYFTDMVEFGGQVFISGYSAVKQQDQDRNHELADVLDYVFEKEDWEISVEELTSLVRDNYEAVLFLCDPNGGPPRTYYSVKGSLGGKLTVNADQLEWDVESITSTFFSPATDSFTIGGSCRVFRYIFGSTGVMIEQRDTGETVPFRK